MHNISSWLSTKCKPPELPFGVVTAVYGYKDNAFFVINVKNPPQIFATHLLPPYSTIDTAWRLSSEGYFRHITVNADDVSAWGENHIFRLA